MVHILAALASYSLLVPFTILYAFLWLHKFDFKNTVKKNKFNMNIGDICSVYHQLFFVLNLDGWFGVFSNKFITLILELITLI